MKNTSVKINDANSVNCYCFNKKCQISIFYSANCKITKVTIQKAMLENMCCTECGSELVSQPVLEAKIKINELLTLQDPPMSTAVKIKHTVLSNLLVGRDL